MPTDRQRAPLRRRPPSGASSPCEREPIASHPSRPRRAHRAGRRGVAGSSGALALVGLVLVLSLSLSLSLLLARARDPALLSPRTESRTMSKPIPAKEVESHKTADSAWVIIDGNVYDVTDFLEDHPGGKKVLLNSCGKDSSEKFWQFHSKKVLEKTAKPFLKGPVAEAAKL